MSALPAVIAEIGAIAGMDAAWALARAKGGQRISLPRVVGKRHWLAVLVGHEAAQKICDHYRGNHVDNIEIPMASAARRAEALSKALAENLSANEIAGQLGVHRRTVFRHRAHVRNRVRDDEDQGSLL